MHRIFDQMIFPPSDNLGDSIVSSAIVRHFARMCEKIHVPVTWHYESMCCLFQDDAHIQVMQYDNFDQLNHYMWSQNLIKINPPHFHAIMQDQVRSTPLWDEQFYAFYDLPYSLRYSGFKLPRQIPGSVKLYEQLTDHKPYCLVHKQLYHVNKVDLDLHSWRTHEDHARVSDVIWIDLDAGITTNVLNYVDLIKHAVEIHCVPSSMFTLVDSMHDLTDAKLFYHDCRRDACMRVNHMWNNHVWQIVPYQAKY